MKIRGKKLLAMALACMVLSTTTMAVAESKEEGSKAPLTYETEKYLIEKISHPTLGQGEADGIITEKIKTEDKVIHGQ